MIICTLLGENVDVEMTVGSNWSSYLLICVQFLLSFFVLNYVSYCSLIDRV